MAGMQETDRLTLKNGITYLLKDAAAREQLASMLAEVMEKYGADNPPPYPVTSVNGQTGDVIVGGAVDSVNGQTGAVVLDANDVGALPNTTQIPSKTSDLANDSGFVNAAGAAAAAPVQSVNGQTGAVTVTVPTAISDLTNDSGFVDAAGAAAAAPVQSVNGQTGDVTIPVRTEVVSVETAFAIPASGASVSYDLDGITSDHELVRWNFSTSAENQPPVDLQWDTYDGYFTITNTSGTTSESMRPVFELPTALAATTH